MMTQEKLNELVDGAAQRRRDLAEQKGKEYTQGNEDRLANFRTASQTVLPMLRDDLNEEQKMYVVWTIFFNKHYDAVKSFFKHGKEFSGEGIEGRIDDMQVYLDLLRGIAHELKENNGKQLELPKACGTEVPF